jgi:ubiquinone biosynthesis accessory factor UbiK
MFSWMKNGIPHPESLASLKDEFEKQAKAVVQGILSRMDLVSRDELDVQLNVLMRTREKLEAVEARLATLEAKHAKHSHTHEYVESMPAETFPLNETGSSTTEPHIHS